MDNIITKKELIESFQHLPKSILDQVEQLNLPDLIDKLAGYQYNILTYNNIKYKLVRHQNNIVEDSYGDIDYEPTNIVLIAELEVESKKS
jgi:hypothetical protein